MRGEFVFPSQGGYGVTVSVTDSTRRTTVVHRQVDVFDISHTASLAKEVAGARTKPTSYGWKGGESWTARERAMQRKPR